MEHFSRYSKMLYKITEGEQMKKKQAKKQHQGKNMKKDIEIATEKLQFKSTF